MKFGLFISCAALLSACSSGSFSPDKGKLLATGGVSQIEGAGGGGLSTWSLITGYGTDKSYGGNTHYTQAEFQDFQLRSYGAAVGIKNRVEFSYNKQEFDTGETGPRLGLREGFTFSQDIYGAKIRVLGDAVYGQDSWVPQVSVGAQYKKASEGDLLTALGAENDSGADVYVSGTKLFLDKSLILGGTLRGTKANHFGLLGFGGDENNNYSLEIEATAAYLVSKNVVICADYRSKPDNLGFAEENDSTAAYIAYFPSKNISITAAYVDAGRVALQGRQSGAYGSLQIGF